MAALRPADLSQLLFQLYGASRSGSVTEFQRRALESLAHQCAFDCAWWGRSTASAGGHQVHCSYPYHLPPDVAERLNSGDRSNVVASRTVAEPGRAHYFDRATLHSQPSTRVLAEHMGIAQSICICDIDPATGISNFLSLARRRARPRFSAADLALLELVAPHMSAALDMALADQLVALRNPERVALLATDAAGSLHVSECGATDLLRTEWPAWTGPLLPPPLIQRIATRQREFLGRQLHVAIAWRGDHAFLSLRRRDPRDLLTRRERTVAAAYASGQSYRQVADGLGLSPATIRHHLRSVYVKLGVSDKAAFATRLGAVVDVA